MNPSNKSVWRLLAELVVAVLIVIVLGAGLLCWSADGDGPCRIKQSVANGQSVWKVECGTKEFICREEDGDECIAIATALNYEYQSKKRDAEQNCGNAWDKKSCTDYILSNDVGAGLSPENNEKRNN